MSSTLRGIPAAAGIAVGTALLYNAASPQIVQEHIGMEAIQQERQRLADALRSSIEELDRLHARVLALAGKEEAAILEVHRMLLEDEELVEGANGRIENNLQNAEWAIWDAADEFAQLLANAGDSYFQGRAADIEDVRVRVVNALQGRKTLSLRYLEQPVIIVATDLLPSSTAELDPKYVLGLITEQGGPNSHTTILARKLEIPAVVGVKNLLETLQEYEGKTISLACDGSTGEVIIAPDEATVQKFQQAALAYRRQKNKLQALRMLPAISLDGVTVEVAANIGHPREAQPALNAGAGGVGLFRTEFLFLDRERAPSEEEQFEAYRTVLHTFARKTVIVRTLDIGGDKSVPYLNLPKESNSFLGLRGLRLCLDSEYQDLFRTQVRALLRAAPQSAGSLWVMFPMVCDLREVRQAKTFLAQTEAQLLQERKLASPVLHLIRIGIMIETPAAALLVDQLAQEVHFFSIGTNDLTQYMLASDRMNARLGELQRPFHPAVMRVIAHSVLTARKLQRWVGMCGEMAGDPRASTFLLGLGINELSMEPGALNAVKQAIRATSTKQAQELVQRVLKAERVEDTEMLLSREQRG